MPTSQSKGMQTSQSKGSDPHQKPTLLESFESLGTTLGTSINNCLGCMDLEAREREREAKERRSINAAHKRIDELFDAESKEYDDYSKERELDERKREEMAKAPALKKNGGSKTKKTKKTKRRHRKKSLRHRKKSVKYRNNH